MKDTPQNSPDDSGAEQAAAEWTLRIDRGLTAAEQDDYTQWLAADPRHRRAMAEFQWAWDEFDRLAGLQTTRHAHVDPDLLKMPKAHRTGNAISSRRSVWWAAVPLGAAAALAVLLLRPEPRQPDLPAPTIALDRLPPRIRILSLEDGSLVHLNHGAVLETAFTGQERRVRLVSGEANFQVTHDTTRPFIVDGGGVEIRAVGTAFDVRLNSSSLDVIVTEGKVRIGAQASGATENVPPLLLPGQRGVVSLDTPAGTSAVQVSLLDPSEIARELAWQPHLLDFDAVPLPQIVSAFNKTNRVSLVVGDSALDDLVLSCAFWSDNVEGFVRLMESSFSLRAEWQGDETIVLRPAGAASKQPL